MAKGKGNMRLYETRWGILAGPWQSQPEGQEAQPIWKGRKQTEQDKQMENNPAFSE